MSDDYRKYEETINGIENSLKMWEELVKDHQCDKRGWGFEKKTDRFMSCHIPALTLVSHRGYYGSSSCSSFFHVGQEDIFNRAFIHVLNIKRKEIMESIVVYLKAESEDAKNKEIKLLEERLLKLKESSKDV